MVRWMCDVKLEQYNERMLTETKIAVVWLSRKNGLDCLAWLVQVESLWLMSKKNIQRANQK